MTSFQKDLENALAKSAAGDTVDLGSFVQYAEEIPETEKFFVAEVDATGITVRDSYPFGHKHNAQYFADAYNREEVEDAEAEMRKHLNRLYVVVKATTAYTMEG